MIADFHLHSNFSGDSDATPESMINRAIELGMKRICFTDHMDTDSEEPDFILDTERYVPKLQQLKAQYRDQIDIGIGVELGMQPQLAMRHQTYVKQYPFDFVIASQHLVDGQDPYYPQVFDGREDRTVYQKYFEEILENVQLFSDFQVLGHLDYVVRYGKNQAQQYNYPDYAEVIDEILRTVINNGNGIEVNTAGLKHGLGFPNPHPRIISRYKELGGEIITIGSDAHEPQYIGYQFDQVKELLKAAKFDYYVEFQQKKPKFIEL